MLWLSLIGGLVLILGTGFFVAVEFAMVALDQPSVQRAIDAGDPRAPLVLSNLKSLSTQLSACQLGITLTTLLTGFILEPAISALLEGPLGLTGIPVALSTALGSIIALVVATLFSMVVGELIPKNISIAIPFAVARALAKPQVFFATLFRPAIIVLNGFSNWILNLMGLEAKEELSGARTPAELSSLVRRSARMGTLEQDTAAFLTRTLVFGERKAEDVMTPRPRVKFAETGQSIADLLEMAGKTGYSRFPLISGSPDDVIGAVHIKNAMRIPKELRAKTPVTRIRTDILKVPESVELDSLLTQLRDANLQMAVVVDEYGGTAGIVSLEDLVEEITGEIADEHDKAAPGVLQAANGSWYFPGLMRPDEISAQVPQLKIEDAPDYETVGGFVMERLGRIPERGDEVNIPGGTLQVSRMDGHRVDRVKFTQRPQEKSVKSEEDEHA